jgi:hypothetical protein
MEQPGKVVVRCDPLEQSLMDGLFQGAVQVRLPAEDEREAVEGVIPVVHEHLDVLQDAGGEVLAWVWPQVQMRRMMQRLWRTGAPLMKPIRERP